MGSVTSREPFANQKALQDYADAHDLAYVWEGMSAFAKRWRVAQLAQPGTYELTEVITKRGVTRALLFPKAILSAEFVRPHPHELGSEASQVLGIPAWPALLDMHIATFDPPEILQALAERRHAELTFGIVLCQPRN